MASIFHLFSDGLKLDPIEMIKLIQLLNVVWNLKIKTLNMFASSLRLYFLVEIIKFRFFLEICIQILAISAFTDFGCLHSNGRFFVTKGTKSSLTIIILIFMGTTTTCLAKMVSQFSLNLSSQIMLNWFDSAADSVVVSSWNINT